MGIEMGLIVAIIILFIYFLPAIIAGAKKKKNATAITLVNLFFGWTFLGWFVALVWAVCND